MNIDLDWCIVCDSRTDRGLYCSNKCSSQDKQASQQLSSTHVTEVDVSVQDEARPHHKEDSLSTFYANHAPSPPPMAKSPTPSEILSSSYTIYSRSRRSSVLTIPSPSPSGKGTYFIRD